MLYFLRIFALSMNYYQWLDLRWQNAPQSKTYLEIARKQVLLQQPSAANRSLNYGNDGYIWFRTYEKEIYQ